MFQQLHIEICLIIILHLHIVCSYRVHHLDVDEENEVLPKLQKLLQGYEIPNYEESKPRKNRYRLKPLGKSMLVKRIIPHGYKTGEYEYDSRLNTVFKPLFRYHVVKPSNERSVVRGMKPEQMSDTISDLISLMRKDRKTSQSANLKQKLQKDIKNYFLKDKKTQKKKRFGGLLNLKKLLNEDRAHLRDLEKSGENNDPWAHDSPSVVPSDASESSKESVKYPHYPFWNYWTYQKTVVQDKCPGHLVKLGNMCVSSVGHRRRRSKRMRSRRAVRHRPRSLRYG